jgi:hypothetical protein
MGDTRACYQVPVARLTVLAASTMNTSDPQRATGEIFRFSKTVHVYVSCTVAYPVCF